MCDRCVPRNGLYFQVKQGVALPFHTLSELLSMKQDELMKPKYDLRLVIHHHFK